MAALSIIKQLVEKPFLSKDDQQKLLSKLMVTHETTSQELRGKLSDSKHRLADVVLVTELVRAE
jgi:hypothetical protein